MEIFYDIKKTIFKIQSLLGFEQAWTPILNLTAPLCKLLALRDLSAKHGHHQFSAKISVIKLCSLVVLYSGEQSVLRQNAEGCQIHCSSILSILESKVARSTAPSNWPASIYQALVSETTLLLFPRRPKPKTNQLEPGKATLERDLGCHQRGQLDFDAANKIDLCR